MRSFWYPRGARILQLGPILRVNPRRPRAGGRITRAAGGAVTGEAAVGRGGRVLEPSPAPERPPLKDIRRYGAGILTFCSK